MLDVINDLYMF